MSDGKPRDYPQVDIERLVDNLGSRAADPARVRARPFESSDDQRQLVEWLFDGLRRSCETPEDAIAVIVYALSEFILRGAKGDSIPEAVETAIRCLRLNTERESNG
jgi:hypothetical protein